MTTVTLHFDAEPGMDAEAVARALQQRCAGLAEVATARSEAIRNRVIGVDDIVVALTLTAEVLGAGALTLEALKRFVAALKGVAEECGLKKCTVEGDGALVAPEELSAADARFIGAAL